MYGTAGGLTKQHDVNELTHAVDVVPTLLQMTGVKKPDGVQFDGVSIADLLDRTKDVDWPKRFVISDSQRVRDPIKWRSSSVMTGKYPFRFGVLAAHAAGMRVGEITIAELLTSKGDRTGFFGKWHLGWVKESDAGSRGLLI